MAASKELTMVPPLWENKQVASDLNIDFVCDPERIDLRVGFLTERKRNLHTCHSNKQFFIINHDFIFHVICQVEQGLKTKCLIMQVILQLLMMVLTVLLTFLTTYR